MKSFILVVAGLAAVSACSNGRDQHIPATDNSAQRADLTLPDTTSRRDTALALSSRGEQPVSPVEQQVPRSNQQTSTARPAPQRRKHAARPAKPAADTSTHAYAPNVKPDTVRAAAAPVPARTSAAPDTSRARPDTSTALKADSAAARTPDTVAAKTPDTTSTPVRDTAPASRAVAAPARSAGMTEAAARTLATGTEIHAALDDSINSRSDTVGKVISAHVMDNVIGPDGRTLISAGTPVQFTVMRLSPAKSKSSQGGLALRADAIAFNGQLQPVKAKVQPVPHELRGRGVTGSDAAKVGVGAAGGAVLGRVLGGSTEGAVIGGVVGAAGGAVVASQTATRDVVVTPKTPVVIVLTAPLVAP